MPLRQKNGAWCKRENSVYFYNAAAAHTLQLCVATAWQQHAIAISAHALQNFGDEHTMADT